MRAAALLLLAVGAACTPRPAFVRLDPPLATHLPALRFVDANGWTREEFIACRVDTDCHRRTR